MELHRTARIAIGISGYTAILRYWEHGQSHPDGTIAERLLGLLPYEPLLLMLEIAGILLLCSLAASWLRQSKKTLQGITIAIWVALFFLAYHQTGGSSLFSLYWVFLFLFYAEVSVAMGPASPSSQGSVKDVRETRD